MAASHGQPAPVSAVIAGAQPIRAVTATAGPASVSHAPAAQRQRAPVNQPLVPAGVTYSQVTPPLLPSQPLMSHLPTPGDRGASASVRLPNQSSSQSTLASGHTADVTPARMPFQPPARGMSRSKLFQPVVSGSQPNTAPSTAPPLITNCNAVCAQEASYTKPPNAGFTSRPVASLPSKPEIRFSYAAAASKQPVTTPRGVVSSTGQLKLEVRPVLRENIVLAAKPPADGDLLTIMPPVHSKTFAGAARPAVHGAARPQSHAPIATKPPLARPPPAQLRPVRHTAPLMTPVRHTAPLMTPIRHTAPQMTPVRHTAPLMTPVAERQASLMKAPAAGLVDDIEDAPSRKETDVRRKSFTTGPQWKQSKYFDVNESSRPDPAPGLAEPPHKPKQMIERQPPNDRYSSNNNNNNGAKPARSSVGAQRRSAQPAAVLEDTGGKRAAVADGGGTRKSSKDRFSRRGSNSSAGSKSSRSSRKGKEECSVM